MADAKQTNQMTDEELEAYIQATFGCDYETFMELWPEL